MVRTQVLPGTVRKVIIVNQVFSVLHDRSDLLGFRSKGRLLALSLAHRPLPCRGIPPGRMMMGLCLLSLGECILHF